jgi:predicted  nucleic acid-binding Zn-ribbon protein
MSAQLRALYDLQQIDLDIASAKHDLEALDDGSVFRRQLAAAEKQLATASDELRKSETELKDSELNLKSIETKRQDFQNKLYSGKVSNPKELQSIEKEIEMLGKSRGQLDERILELYDIVETQQAAAAKIGKIVEQGKQRLALQTSQFNAKTNELNAAIVQLTEKRQKALGAVTDQTLLQRYESIRKRHKDTGLAKVENGKCGGCHISLTPFTLRLLKENKEYQTCESCGRILFLDE